MWSIEYIVSLRSEFKDIIDALPDRLNATTSGRVVPEPEDLSIGSGRKFRGAVLFFDIRGFTNRTGSPNEEGLKNTLYMLNTVIPMVMKLVHDHGGYVEKNTGDGLMAIIGAEAGITNQEASKAALEVAISIFYILSHIINPHLIEKGIEPVNARIGIDIGDLLIAKIGVPRGSAAQDRSFLTAVGPCANLACKLQQLAGTNEIWVGDLVKTYAPSEWQEWFINKTPTNNWTWIYEGTSNTYRAWHFNAWRNHPVT
jgi:class 3 adenylate cyclase